jgi:DNA-binding response OmpR family regulator
MNHLIQVLFRDKDPETRESVAQALRGAGFESAPVKNNPQALEIPLDHPVDLTILGIILPILNGLKDCRSQEMPTLLIRSAGQEGQATNGRNSAQVKVVRLSELVEYVRDFIQTGEYHASPTRRTYRYEDLVLDLDARRVVKQERDIQVSPTEFRLLHHLMQRTGSVVSKDELLRQVWGCYNVTGDYNLVDTAIKRLRRAIGDNSRRPRYIQTVWGSGYRFGPLEQTAREEVNHPTGNVVFQS